MYTNVLISNPDYFGELLSYEGIKGIYIELERINPGRLPKLCQNAHKAGKKLYLALPYIWNEAFMQDIRKTFPAISNAQPDGYLVRNLDELGFLSSRNAQGEIILDAGLYTWNKMAMAQLGLAGGTRFTLPYELNKHEMARRGFNKSELVVYGYYPMMISNNCLRLTTKACVKNTDPYSAFRLKDRTGAEFRALNCCKYCYNIILNSVPTWLMDVPETNEAESVRLSFTIESRLEMKSILDKFFSGDRSPKASITRGHYKRGAE